MASFASGLGTGLGISIGYGTISEYTRLGLLWAKWKALPRDMKTWKIAEALQSLLDAEKDEVTGLSSKGAVDAIYHFIDKTLDFAWQVDEGIASQMFVQMIQQSIAYAIHSSHAGSIGTMGNVFSGSMYLSGTESMAIGSHSDYIDKEFKAFLSAEVGQNIPTLTFNLVRGANTRLEDAYRSAMRNVDTILDEWNDLALSYYRHYHTMARERFADSIKMKETATDRAYGLLEQVANEHLARISEQLDTLEGAKAWWDADLMTEDELKEVAVRINLEREASEGNYDEYKTDIIDAINLTITEWDAKITQALGDLTDNETKYSMLLRAMLDTIFNDVVNFANTLVTLCDEAIEDVCAYRNVTKSTKIVEYEAVPPIVPGVVGLEGEFSDWTIYDSFDDTGVRNITFAQYAVVNRSENKALLVELAPAVMMVYDIPTKTLEVLENHISASGGYTAVEGTIKSVQGTYVVSLYAHCDGIKIYKNGAIQKDLTYEQLGLNDGTIRSVSISRSGKYVFVSGKRTESNLFGWVVLVGS